MHVGWNLMSKKQTPGAAFFLLMTAFACIPLLPVPFYYFDLLSTFTMELWLLLILTASGQTLYLTTLAASYRKSEMSLAYPLIRSLPVLLVPAICFFLQQGKNLDPLWELPLMFIIASACLMIPLNSWKIGDSQRPITLKSLLRLPRKFIANNLHLTFASALGVTIYTIVDDRAIKAISHDHSQFHIVEISLLWLTLEYGALLLLLALYVFITKVERLRLSENLKGQKAMAAKVGLISQAGYFLILLAYNYADNVSYVAAFRQLSIPLGAAVAILHLKESTSAPKATGLILMTLALILLAFPSPFQ